MISPEPAKPTAQLGLGCNLQLAMGVFVFIAFMIVTVIPSTRDALAGAIHCPGATEIITTERDGGTVGSGSNPTRTTVVTLTCIFANAPDKTVGNDTVFITAVAAGIGIGALIGLVVGLLMSARERLNNRPA